MRVPPFERYSKITQAVAFMVVGGIIGSIVYHSIFFMNFNALVNINREQEDTIAEYEERIQKLNQFKDQHTVIKIVLPVLLDNRGDK